jgi:hypothetical protein
MNLASTELVMGSPTSAKAEIDETWRWRQSVTCGDLDQGLVGGQESCRLGSQQSPVSGG